MTDRPGVPARDLSDEELERQGVHAHAMRHWVFLHGTAEQFRTHTERMLELEQEYLRRHPQRTWQGSGGDTVAPSRDERIRDLVQTFSRAITALLDEAPTPVAGDGGRRDPEEAQLALLRRFAEAPAPLRRGPGGWAAQAGGPPDRPPAGARQPPGGAALPPGPAAAAGRA